MCSAFADSQFEFLKLKSGELRFVMRPVAVDKDNIQVMRQLTMKILSGGTFGMYCLIIRTGFMVAGVGCQIFADG